MKSISFDRVVRFVQKAAKVTSGLEAVFVFGSTTRGRMHPESDLDVAVLFVPDLARETRGSARRRFQDEVGRLTGLECDVVNLDEASTWLKYHIVKTGRLVVERSRKHTRLFVARALTDYFDFQLIYERMERRLLERLKVA